MEAHVNPTPTAVERLAAQLQTDNAQANTITVQPNGYTHGKTEQRFEIILAGKRQVLTSLFRSTDVCVLDVASKRSGAVVRTTIHIKVPVSTDQTLLN